MRGVTPARAQLIGEEPRLAVVPPVTNQPLHFKTTLTDLNVLRRIPQPCNCFVEKTTSWVASKNARGVSTSRVELFRVRLGQDDLVAFLERDDGFLPVHRPAFGGSALTAQFAAHV